jgi:peptidoglycan/LPS O-acetylase OafA/YrhL
LSESGSSSRVPLIDILRGYAILAIVALHFFVDTRGVPGRELRADAAWRAWSDGDPIGALQIAASALVGLPAFRLDLLLFVTGLVLCLGAPLQARVFWRRRARAVLPSYWIGTLLVTCGLVVFAAVRAFARDTPIAAEIAGGSLLGRLPYHFDWLDVVRSLSIVGRLSSEHIQAIAPSLWYVLLIAQVYLMFPLLRWSRDRMGTGMFVAVCVFVTWVARAGVFWIGPVPGFNEVESVVYFAPFRLSSVAMGMAAASWRGSVAALSPRLSLLAVLPALAWCVGAIWLAADIHVPRTIGGVLGAAPLLALSLPAIWILASAAAAIVPVGRWLAWAGRRSLSLLVVQDVFRLAVGTCLGLGLALDDWFWPLLPAYVGLAMMGGRVFHQQVFHRQGTGLHADSARPLRPPGRRSGRDGHESVEDPVPQASSHEARSGPLLPGGR